MAKRGTAHPGGPGGVAELRRRLGLTQGKLAELLGVHAMTVSKWERGLLFPAAHQATVLDALWRAAGEAREVGREVRQLTAFLNQALVDVTEVEGMQLSASNQLRGKVVSLQLGPVTSRVTIEIAPGVHVVSLITSHSVERLKLKVGGEAVAIIKATEVIVGVPDGPAPKAKRGKGKGKG